MNTKNSLKTGTKTPKTLEGAALPQMFSIEKYKEIEESRAKTILALVKNTNPANFFTEENKKAMCAQQHLD